MTIRQGTIDECIEIQSKIPEFSDNQYDKTDYENRLNNTKSLILVAESRGELVGFKVGYQREEDGSFYSWMGGVLPKFRKHKIAQQLADYQEDWAKKNGYSSITFKTRNSLKAMQIFALKNGFHIDGIEKKEKIKDYRIILKKEFS